MINKCQMLPFLHKPLLNNKTIEHLIFRPGFRPSAAPAVLIIIIIIIFIQILLPKL